MWQWLISEADRFRFGIPLVLIVGVVLACDIMSRIVAFATRDTREVAPTVARRDCPHCRDCDGNSCCVSAKPLN